MMVVNIAKARNLATPWLRQVLGTVLIYLSEYDTGKADFLETSPHFDQNGNKVGMKYHQIHRVPVRAERKSGRGRGLE
jgi:hypothetical protein